MSEKDGRVLFDIMDMVDMHGKVYARLKPLSIEARYLEVLIRMRANSVNPPYWVERWSRWSSWWMFAR